MTDLEVRTGPLATTRALERWLGGLSPHTSRGYQHDLTQWLTWCADHGVDAGSPTGRDLTEHLAGLDRSIATRARRMSAIRSFYAYAREEGLTDADPMPPKAQRPRVKGINANRLGGLGAQQAQALLAAAFADSDRSAALVGLLLTTGLRISEALSIDTLDRDTASGRVTATVLGKGSKWRTVVVPPMVAEQCAKLGRPLFTTRTGRRLSPREAHKLIRRLGLSVGIEGAHPHELRHTAATLSVKGGANLEAVRRMLGHASLGTTQIYVEAAGMLDQSPAYLLASVVSPVTEGGSGTPTG